LVAAAVVQWTMAALQDPMAESQAAVAALQG
jgi:hypothetical protein